MFSFLFLYPTRELMKSVDILQDIHNNGLYILQSFGKLKLLGFHLRREVKNIKIVQLKIRISYLNIIPQQNYYIHTLTPIFHSCMSSSILFPTNQYATSSKSSQEIQKLMIPQQSPQQTLFYILNKGHPLQLPYVYKNFHKFHKNLLSLVCEKLDKEEAENQIIITQSIKTLLKNNSIKLQNQEIQNIFASTLTALKNWNTINNQHLVQVIEITLEKQQTRAKILKEIQKTILDMGKPTEPIISKVIAGRLVSIIVKYMGRSIKGEMIDIIKKIITSPEAEAKKIWINEIFPKLLENLDIEFIQLHLQEKVYETIYDQNEQIGLMALEIILRNATKFSIQEQGSRIVKLFIDSMTSKSEKIVLMTTSFMGETYQKLQNIILKSQTNCIRFWKSLIEVAQAKNQKIINNFIYNLPGILLLSKKYHRVDPLCDVYIQLFFHPDSDTILLVSFFHEMVKMFPSKHKFLKETMYSLLNQVFQDNQPSDQSLKIVDCLLIHLKESKEAFFDEPQKYQERQNNINENKYNYFDSSFNEYLHKYFTYCFQRKNGNYLINFYQAIKKCHQYFSPGFTEVTLLPRLYSSLRLKTAYLDLVIQILIIFLAREVSSNTLINNYASKFNVELSKSSKSHERQSSMLFFYYASFYFSIQTFQQFKMGEKFLQFNNEKNLKNKLLFIKYLPRMAYFFTRQQKIQFTVTLNKLRKDPDLEIIKVLEKTDFTENELKKQEILNKSKAIKEKEKARGTINSKKVLLPNRRQTKELKKEDILKKRVDTRSRPKIIIKQLPKRKTPMSIARVNRKNI